MTNDKWIKWEWSEENRYPETLDTLIYVRLADGYSDIHTNPSPVAFWYGYPPFNFDESLSSNFHPECCDSARIVEYMVADESSPDVELDRDEVVKYLKAAVAPNQHPENTRKIIKELLQKLGEEV